MLLSTEIDICARQTIHAFLLEIAMANGLRTTADPEKTLAQLRAEFLQAPRYKSTVPNQPDPDKNIDLAVHTAAVSYAERFFDSLDQRLKELMG